MKDIERLTDGWRLLWDEHDAGKRDGWYNGLPQRGAKDVKVPSFVHLYFPDCFGVSWYEKRLVTALKADADHILQLRFACADFITELYVNGVFIGRHVGGEDPFSFDVSSAIKEDAENLLCIRVSKPHAQDVDGYSFKEIPKRNQRPNDLLPGHCFNVYGLSGCVDLVRLPKVHIRDSFVSADPKTGEISVEYAVTNCYDQPVPVTLKTECGRKSAGEPENQDIYEFMAQPGDSAVTRKIHIEELLLWDIDDPNLYSVNMFLSSPAGVHRACKSTGFRTFEVGEDGFFYLNGRRIFLRCTHTGNCMPESTFNLTRIPELIRRDFIMAKAAGFNTVRFIAGAGLPEQMDLCDEIGLMVYEEPMSSWLQGNGPRAKELYQQDLLSVVRRDRSHPSVTIWGLLNETCATGPNSDCCFIARDSLKELRKLDPTRLVLYSSGRFDQDAAAGSLSNPYTDSWQYLWNKESPQGVPVDAREAEEEMPDAFYGHMGDVHIYPKYPHSKKAMDVIRTVGCDVKRPVFVSEYGVGSLFNVLWLCRKFEEMDADPAAPDVKMVYSMAETFLKELKKYGLEDQYAYPADILRESERMHAVQRRIAFDLVRSNPYINGFSITGMLDHSICGEGLWTLMREWKPGIADVLQGGFARLRWCLFLSDTHIYSGREFTVEGVLANEGVLKAGAYDISVSIMGKNGVVYREKLALDVTEDMLKIMSIPVFKRTLTLPLAAGEYELRAEILKGAAAHDGSMTFYVTDYADIRAEEERVVVCGIDSRMRALLADKGISTVELEDADINSSASILIGDMENADKQTAWNKLRELIARGSHAFAASRYAFVKDEDYDFYLPMEHKPKNTPAKKVRTDGLYHKEYIARRDSGYFDGLPGGMLDWQYYMQMISGHYFACEEDSLPEEIHSASFGVGIISQSGCDGGLMLGTYRVGKGTLTVCAYELVKNIGVNPAADRMTVNALNMAFSRLRAD